MEYEVSLQTIAWIKERKTSGSLEISPKFQRRAVWLEKERSSLMETILLKLPFPEVYVQVETDQDTGSQKYIVVDGQQRINSILMFMDGEVSLPLDSDWEGITFNQLSPEEKRIFWDYKVVVRMLRNTNDSEIRDLFQKLNTNNIVLNNQELRNAKYTGKFKEACERLADDSFFQHIGLFTPREVRRMEDIEFVSELLVLVVDGIQNKKEHLEDYYANFNEEFPGESEYDLQFKTALNLVQQLSQEENKNLIKTKSNFYSIFGACLKYYKETGRTSFNNSATIKSLITELLSKAKTYRPQVAGEEQDLELELEAEASISDDVIREYNESVSRAASDRSRRAKRERIIYEIITTEENIAEISEE